MKPFAEFFSRQGAVALLLLVVLYKLGDAFAGNLTTTFLLRGPGFSLTEVGAINKGFGLAATILGALAGGALMAKMRLYRALLLFGVLQAVTNLGFMLLAASGKNYALMVTVIGLENLCGGMGTAAYVALLMALCDRRFSATQYALLSALSAVGRVYVGPGRRLPGRRAGLARVLPLQLPDRAARTRAAGLDARAQASIAGRLLTGTTVGGLIDAMGFVNFYLLTTLAALPGVFLFWFMIRSGLADLSIGSAGRDSG